MKSPEKTVSSQLQQVEPEDRTKAGKAAAQREEESSVPDWEEWDLEGIDDKFDSIDDEGLRDEVVDAFERGSVDLFGDLVGSNFPEAAKLIRDKDSSFSSMPDPLKRSVRAYTGGHYEYMNEYLRGGRKRDFSSDEDLVDLIMTYVNNAERAIRKYGVTTRPVVVNRGFEGDFWDTWKEGETRQLLEFVSTSVRGEGFDGRNVVHIYIPPNKGCGIYVDGESLHSNEWEYLIAPDSKFKVHHIEINEGEAGEVHEYWLELIP